MNLETKVEVTIGCLNFLTAEVETLRQENKELKIENEAINRFLSLTESIQPKSKSAWNGTDLLWQAKREIKEAISAKESVDDSKSKPIHVPV